MNKKKEVVVFIALLTFGGQALAQGQEIEFKSNADDLTKIRSVLEEFRQDVIHKDAYALTKLMLNPNVLFHSIDNQEAVDSARKYNARFDGIGPSALDGFAKFLSTSKDKLEEKFHNIEIRQDGDLGLVTFNYDFVINDIVTNSGVEHWEVRKIDGQWKILSVTWTRYVPS
jgi:ketosteroid isomerase-like protein